VCIGCFSEPGPAIDLTTYFTDADSENDEYYLLLSDGADDVAALFSGIEQLGGGRMTLNVDSIPIELRRCLAGVSATLRGFKLSYSAGALPLL
jgi:hypothetical protein